MYFSHLRVNEECDILTCQRMCLQIGVALRIFSSPAFWMELILVYIVTFSLRYCERALRWLFFPNDDMILAEAEAAAAAAACRRRKAPSARDIQMGSHHGANHDRVDRDAPCMA